MSALKLNDWESVVEFNLRYNRWLLVPLGLWIPKKNIEKVIFQFFILLTLFILFIYLIPHTLYILLVVTDRAEQLILFGPLSEQFLKKMNLSYGIMGIGKYLFVLKHIPGIATCVNLIKEDWQTYISQPEKKQLMIMADRWVDNFTKICVIFLFGGAMAHNVFVPFLEMIITILKTPNATLYLNAPFYFGSKVYKDSSDGFMFAVMFFTHTTSFVFMNLVSVGLGTLMARFVMHSCGQIEIMLMELELTINKANDENWSYINYQSNLKLVVVKHLRILRFIGYTEDIFTGVYLVEFVMSTIGICVLGYYIIGAVAAKNISAIFTLTSILIAYVLNIYIYCYLGSRLTEMCEQIGVKAYDINWTDLLAKKYGDSGMQMIIMIAQHPPMLTAGKIFFLTVETFTSVMKASAAYLNMLRTVTEEV